MPADDLRKGVEGKGQTWKEEVDTDEAQSAYESGATSDAASEYENNAAASQERYEAGLARYYGVEPEDITTGGDFASGVGDAGRDWQSGVGRSGAKWRRGVGRADANEWEQNTAAAADRWFANARDGVQGNR